MASPATLYTGCIPSMMMSIVCHSVHKANSHIKTTVSIHVATANNTGSYKIMGLIVTACGNLCGCVVVYYMWVNSQVCLINTAYYSACSYTTVMHGCADVWTALMDVR